MALLKRAAAWWGSPAGEDSDPGTAIFAGVRQTRTHISRRSRVPDRAFGNPQQATAFRSRERRVTELAPVFRWRLGNYQPAADPEEWGPTFRRHRRRSKAPGHHCRETSPVPLLAAQLFGSRVDDLDVREDNPRSSTAHLKKSVEAVRGIDQDETKLL